MIIQLATWLSKTDGFISTCAGIVVGLLVGAMLDFDDHWSLIFNLLLSIAALLIAGLILVAGAKDTASIQIKLDELIRAVEAADNRLIGLDQKSAEDVEAARAEVGAVSP
jgi:low affinity Fe/Cu permease